MGFRGDAMKVQDDQLNLLLEIAQLASEAIRIANSAKRLLSGEAISELNEQLLAASEQVTAGLTHQEELKRELSRHEGDLEMVLRRIAVDQKRINETSNPKDAVGISHELETLAKRQLELEDQELEIMSQLEAADAELSRLTAVREEIEAQLTALRADTKTEVEHLKAEHAAVMNQIKTSREQIAPELLEVFDAKSKRGVPIGRLVKGTCGACHMGLTSTAVSAMHQAAGELKICPECTAILVVA
jgi:uncharacterized protein